MAATTTLHDYTLQFATTTGHITGLQRGESPPVLGHGTGLALPAAAIAWKNLDVQPVYRQHTVTDNSLTLTVELGPLTIDDMWAASGSLLQRHFVVSNESDAEVQLTGIRVGLGGVSIGDPADCRFDAPGNMTRPHVPLSLAASQTIPTSIAPGHRGPAYSTDFAPGAPQRWGRAFGDAPDVGPGLLIVHNPEIEWNLLTWHFDRVEAGTPWVSGDGTHTALGFDLWLSGWLAPGESLPVGTQYILLHKGTYASALDTFRETYYIQNEVIPTLYGAVDRAADWNAIYEVQPGQFGGFAGLQAEVPRLSDMGIDTLYLMPIHPHRNKPGLPWDENWEAIGSPYGIHDFEALAPSLGTPDEFQALVDAAHQHGMRVLVDLVTQGCSLEARYVTEQPDWFARDEQGQMVHSHGWNDTWSFDWANLTYQQFVIKYATDLVKKYGIDGFRVDAPHGKEPNWARNLPYHASATSLGTVPLLENLRQEMLELGADGGLFCELFGPLWIHSHEISYDYHPFTMFYALAEGTLSPRELGDYLRDYWAVMPEHSPRVCFTETHDTRHWPAYAWRGSAVARALLGLMVVTGFVPMIWAGQEAGQHDFIAGLLKARGESKVLRRGKMLYNAVEIDDMGHYRRDASGGPADEVFAVLRHTDNQVIFGLASFCPEHVTYQFSLPVADLSLDHNQTYRLRDLITGQAWSEYGRTSWTGAELTSFTLTPRMYMPYLFALEAE